MSEKTGKYRKYYPECMGNCFGIKIKPHIGETVLSQPNTDYIRLNSGYNIHKGKIDKFFLG